MRSTVSSEHGPARSPLSTTLFVSDLDGTLLPSGKELPLDQAEALNDLVHNGLQFTVATARSIQAVNALLKGVHLNLPAITLGGSLVTLPDSLVHLLARVISKRVSTDVLTMLHRRGILPFVAALHNNRDWAFYSRTTSEAAQWYVDEKRAYGDPRLCWYNHPSDILGTQILTITFFVEQEDLGEITRDLKQVEGCMVSSFPVRHFPVWHEVSVSHPEADKGEALRGLRRLWNARWDRVVAFGDDINDLPLFEAADIAIAVQNAVPEVLARADQVIRNNDAGSVINYLARHPLH